MRLVVTGSIATDYLMVFPGRFADQLLADRLASVSLSFLVDRLDIRRGGVAANIAFGLGQFGLRPTLVGAVGEDFAEYRAWLDGHGVDTESVYVSTTQHTARFLCTSDDYQNQIAAFYTGAMSEARDIELLPIVERLGGVDLVVVAPNDPTAMLRHTEECRTRGYRFAADPSQQLARMDRPDIRSFVDGADWLFTNEYETGMLLAKAQWSRDDVLERVGTWVTTLGAEGVRIESRDAEPLQIPAVPVKGTVDPTGAGDAFRAGLLAGLAAGVGVERAAQLGCGVAVLALEARGPQDYVLNADDLTSRLGDVYGTAAVTELSPILGVHNVREAARL